MIFPELPSNYKSPCLAEVNLYSQIQFGGLKPELFGSSSVAFIDHEMSHISSHSLLLWCFRRHAHHWYGINIYRHQPAFSGHSKCSNRALRLCTVCPINISPYNACDCVDCIRKRHLLVLVSTYSYLGSKMLPLVNTQWLKRTTWWRC